jgi:hypothetical protein
MIMMGFRLIENLSCQHICLILNHSKMRLEIHMQILKFCRMINEYEPSRSSRQTQRHHIFKNFIVIVGITQKSEARKS